MHEFGPVISIRPIPSKVFKRLSSFHNFLPSIQDILYRIQVWTSSSPCQGNNLDNLSQTDQREVWYYLALTIILPLYKAEITLYVGLKSPILYILFIRFRINRQPAKHVF